MLKTQLLGIALLLLCEEPYAASFDCSQANSPIEKMVCTDAELSRLDDQLRDEFKNSKENSVNPKILIQEQRKWLAEDRNKCQDIECLKLSYAARIKSFSRASNAQQIKCPIEEKMLIGTWMSTGTGDFQEMRFEKNGNERPFLSWLHHRLEMSGIWAFDQCEIHISDPINPKLSFDYRITKYIRDTLFLQEVEGKEHAEYKKIK